MVQDPNARVKWVSDAGVPAHGARNAPDGAGAAPVMSVGGPSGTSERGATATPTATPPFTHPASLADSGCYAMRVDVLDDEFRPILERVITYTNASTCHALRATCRRLHTTIDRLLFRHVSLVFKSVTVVEGDKRRLVDGMAVMYRRLPPKPESVEDVIDQESITSDATSSETEGEDDARESEDDHLKDAEEEEQARPIMDRRAQAEHADFDSRNRHSRVESSSEDEHGQHIHEGQYGQGHKHAVDHPAHKRREHHGDHQEHHSSGHHEHRGGRHEHHSDHPEHHGGHHDHHSEHLGMHGLPQSEHEHPPAGNSNERDDSDGQEGGNDADYGTDPSQHAQKSESHSDKDQHKEQHIVVLQNEHAAEGNSEGANSDSKVHGKAPMDADADSDATADPEPVVANLLPPRRHMEYRHSLDSHPLRRLLEQNGYKVGELDLDSEHGHGFHSEQGHEYHGHEYRGHAHVHALGDGYESAGREGYTPMDKASNEEGSEGTDKSSQVGTDQRVGDNDPNGQPAHENVAVQDAAGHGHDSLAEEAEPGLEAKDGDVAEEAEKPEVLEVLEVLEETLPKDPPMRMETFEYVRLPILPFPFVEEAEEPTPTAAPEHDLAVAVPTLAPAPASTKPRSIAQRVRRVLPLSNVRWPCASAAEFDDRHTHKRLLPSHPYNGQHHQQYTPVSPSRLYDPSELERPLPPLPDEKGIGPSSDSASALIPAAPTPASAAGSGSTGASPKISRASLKDSWERALEYAHAVDLHGDFNPQDIDSYWAPGGRLRSLLSRANADVVRDLRDLAADCVVPSEVWTCWIGACPFAPRDPDAEELDMGDADEPTPQGDPTLILKPPRAAYRLVLNLPWHPTAAVKYCRLGALLASAEVERVVENGGEVAIVFHRAQPPNPDMLDPEAARATKPYGYPGFLKGLAAVLGFDDEFPGDPGEGNGSIVTFVNLDIIQPDEIGAVAVPVGGVRAESPPEGFPLALWYMCLGLERHVRKRNAWRGRVFHQTMMEWCSSDEDAMLQLGRPPHPETALAGCVEEDDACAQVCGGLGQINLQ